MPQSTESVSKSMLANIASINIPPLINPYLDWLDGQLAATLLSFGVDPAALHDRKFTPRLLPGQYFRDLLLALVDQATAAGITVTVRGTTEVTEVVPNGNGLMVVTRKVRHGDRSTG